MRCWMLQRWGILLAVIPMIAFARSGDDTLRTYRLDPVIVTATRMEVLRSSVPTAVSVVTKEELRQSGETSVLSVLNKRVPGLFITERGVLGYGVAQGAAGTISIRGVGGSPNTDVLVLTDGRPQMMGLMGHPLPDTYVTSGVERVEIIRGPGSVLYGTNAMGGVVNIITEHSTEPGTRLSGGGSWGSYGTNKLELGGGYGFGTAGLSAFVNHAETRGHRPYGSFKINNGSLRGAVHLDDHYTLTADASLSAFKTYDPGPASSPGVDNWVDIVRGSSGLAIENRHASMTGGLKLFFNFGRHKIYDGFRSNDQHFGANLYQGFQINTDLMLTAGLDFMQYGGKAENIIGGVDFGTHYVNELAAYALTQYRLTRAVSLTGGLRVNRGSVYGVEIVPQLGTALHVTGQTTVKISASKGFRSPTIRELYLFPAPTPTLEPERMWNYEIGVLHNFDAANNIEVTAFVLDGENMIRTEGFFPALRLSNSGRFVHRGIEVAGKVSPVVGFDMNLAYTYLDPENQTAGNPRHKLYVGTTYRYQLFSANLGFSYVERLFGSDDGVQPLPAYALLNGRIAFDAPAGFTVFVSGENLLNRPYQIVFDYPMPGRTFTAGINWALK